SSLFNSTYPRWSLAVNLSYPLGGSAQQANTARARIQTSQVQAQMKQIELQVATDVTNAAVSARSNVERVEAAQAARELAQKQLEAEQSKFEVGMSTNYNVIQSQRDLATAQNNELQAILNYRKSLVELERLQQTTLQNLNITVLSPTGAAGARGAGTAAQQTSVSASTHRAAECRGHRGRRRGGIPPPRHARDAGRDVAHHARRHHRHRGRDGHAAGGHHRAGRQPGVGQHQLARRGLQLDREEGAGRRPARSLSLRGAARAAEGEPAAGAREPCESAERARADQGAADRRAAEIHARQGAVGEEPSAAERSRLGENRGRHGAGRARVAAGDRDAGDRGRQPVAGIGEPESGE